MSDEICAFVSPSGIHCMLTRAGHLLRRWHMAWVDRIPNLKMVGDFVPQPVDSVPLSAPDS